jgi:hypothetical protein
MVEHVTITDPNIHEPKGVSTAANNTVYRANGGGSGAWTILSSNSLNMTEIEGVLRSDAQAGTLLLPTPFVLTGVITDVSTASSLLFAIPTNCRIIGGAFTLGGAITVANSVVSVKNAAGSSMGANVNIVQAGSAKGTTFTFTATSNNNLTGPTWMEVATDGASTTAQPLYVTINGVFNA